MADKAELKIGSSDIEKTTVALNNLIDKLEKIAKVHPDVVQSSKQVEASQRKIESALKSSDIQATKHIELMELQRLGLDNTGSKYAKLKAEILAKEQAAKKGIATDSEEYRSLLKNIKAKELAAAKTKKLAEVQPDVVQNSKQVEASQRKIEAALKSSDIQATKHIELMKLQGLGLDNTGSKYAKLKAEILAKEQAAKKGIATDSEEYRSLLKNVEAKELAAAKTKKLDTVHKDVVQSSKQVEASQRKIEAALKSSDIQATKHIELMKLQGLGLDNTGSKYAKLKAEILAKEQAAKKGIATDSEEYRSLLKNVKAKELAAAKTKKLGTVHKDGAKSSDKYTSHLDRMTKQVQIIDGPLGGISSRMTALSSIMKSGALAFAAAGVGVGLLLREVYKGIGIAADSEVAMKSFEAQILATGGSAGFTAEELDGLSRSLAMGTLDSTEDMRKLVGVMLTFKNVSGQAFTESIGLAQSLGKAMQQDPVTAARTLGKVLNNPLENYKQLSRAGIEFNEDQKRALTLAQQQGKMYQAQSIVLDKLKGKFGSLAESQADTLRGDVDTFGQKWDEVRETIGEKLIPLMRTLTQVGIAAADAMQWVTDSDEDLIFKGWESSFETLKKELPELELELRKVRLESAKLGNTELSDTFQDWLSSIPAADLVMGATLADKVEAYAKIEATLQKTIDARRKQQAGQGENKALDKFLEDTELKIAGERRLTDVFLRSGDSRSMSYRREIATVKAMQQAKKLNVETDEAEVQNLIDLQLELSNLTEERVKYNTVVQIQKSLQGEVASAEKEVKLQKLVASGISKSSAEYLKLSAALVLKQKLLKANIDPNSKEAEGLKKQSDALVVLQTELQKAQTLQSLGLGTAPEFKGVFDPDSIIGAQAAMFEEIRQLQSLGIEDEVGYQEALQSIYDEFAVIKGEKLGMHFQADKDGRLTAISELEAIELEKQERLKLLDDEAKIRGLDSDEQYLIRRNEINAEYDQKMVESRQKAYEASAEHKKRMKILEVGMEVQAGLETLSAVAGNNKKLAKLAKASAVFNAGVSLVEALSQASAQPYPLNIPLYAKAFVQGTQLIQQAQGLKEPAYAFGSVDIQGAGTGRSDSIRAKIASGESVITAPATARHKETLKRMNQGLPIKTGTSGTVSVSNQIVIQGDASENTVRAIDERLVQFEERVQSIARGASLEVIQEESEVGGLFDPI